LLADGAPEEIRTPDPQIRSLVLYPAELRARFSRRRRFNNPHASKKRFGRPRKSALATRSDLDWQGPQGGVQGLNLARLPLDSGFARLASAPE
jgi:hypothetical protein